MLYIHFDPWGAENSTNRYRQNYKQLEKLRQKYFERITNDTIDFERFIDYFKWIDTSLSKMLIQICATFGLSIFIVVFWSIYKNL